MQLIDNEFGKAISGRQESATKARSTMFNSRAIKLCEFILPVLPKLGVADHRQPISHFTSTIGLLTLEQPAARATNHPWPPSGAT